MRCCRQAAETLLCLTGMEPAVSNAASGQPGPPAGRTPSLAELSAANIAERGAEASPLQALVQDIMREQQQRQAAAQASDPSIKAAAPRILALFGGQIVISQLSVAAHGRRE